MKDKLENLITVRVFLREYKGWTAQQVYYQKKAKRPKIRFKVEHGVTFVELIDGSPFTKLV
jgi:hypothetical protein